MKYENSLRQVLHTYEEGVARLPIRWLSLRRVLAAIIS